MTTVNKGFASIFFFLIVLGSLSVSGGEDTAQHRIVMQVAEFSLLNVTGSPEELSVIPLHPGVRDFQYAVDSSVNLQYSSTVGLNQHRSITARWGLSDSAPAGCLFKILAVPSGRQNEGFSVGEKVITSENQILLSGIGSCATGTELTDGAVLVYTLTVVDASELVPGELKTASIFLTLTDVT
jgi:hypothetical protein